MNGGQIKHGTFCVVFFTGLKTCNAFDLFAVPVKSIRIPSYRSIRS